MGVTREERLRARWQIIQSANQFKVKFWIGTTRVPKLFGMRQLQRAVFLVRQRKLVSEDTLRNAGFRGD